MCNVSDILTIHPVCRILLRADLSGSVDENEKGTIMSRAVHVSLVLLGAVALSITAASPAAAICKKEKGYYDGISGNFCAEALSKENGEYNEPTSCGGDPGPPPKSVIAFDELLRDRARTGREYFPIAGFSLSLFSVT
jgi:hypothetical protein